MRVERIHRSRNAVRGLLTAVFFILNSCGNVDRHDDPRAEESKENSLSVRDRHRIPAGVDSHLRILTWNIEVLNIRNEHEMHTGDPYGPRTDEQMYNLARRIVDFEASVIVLQEINDMTALHGLLDLMNSEAGSDRWQIFPPFSDTFQQNALVYNADKVGLSLAEYVPITPSGSPYPAEADYRAPTTGIFTSTVDPETSFRIIGIHGSWQNSEIRSRQGLWLASYIAELTRDSEAQPLILVGDMNGKSISGHAPHDGIVSTGIMSNVPKRNGEATTLKGNGIDTFYANRFAMSKLLQPSAFVIRNDFYGETPEQFRETYSDHFPVFIDYYGSEAAAKNCDFCEGDAAPARNISPAR